MADPKYEEEVSGCTACVGIITKDKIFCVSIYRRAHSPCILYSYPSRATQVIHEPSSASRAGQSPCLTTTNLRMKVSRDRTHAFSSLWMLTAAAEKSRICAAGGFVDFGRVNGNLALSRAIGDFEFKKSAELPPEQQIVTAFPDVSEHDITDDDEFLVVACDGTLARTFPKSSATG